MRKPVFAIIATTTLVVSCKRGGSHSAGAASGSVAAAAPGFLAGFEGDIVLRAKSKNGIRVATVTVKGKKMRFDVPESMQAAPTPAGPSYALVDAGSRKVRTVLPRRRAFVEVDLASSSETTAPAVTKTGNTDTVAGILCEEWKLAGSQGASGLVCVSNEPAPWLEVPALGIPHAELWAREVFDGKHFPLRAIEYDAAGAESSRIELTKLERKAVDDSTLAVPAGYRRMEVGELMAELEAAVSSAMPRVHSPDGK